MTLNDGSEYMKSWALREKVMTETASRRTLIGSFFDNGKLISTQLLRWYLEKGLVVSRVHHVMSYLGKRVFSQFAETIVDMRREAATSGDANAKRQSLMYKLMGNR